MWEELNGFFVGTVEHSLGRRSDLEYWMMMIIIWASIKLGLSFYLISSSDYYVLFHLRILFGL